MIIGLVFFWPPYILDLVQKHHHFLRQAPLFYIHLKFQQAIFEI